MKLSRRILSFLLILSNFFFKTSLPNSLRFTCSILGAAGFYNLKRLKKKTPSPKKPAKPIFNFLKRNKT